MSLEPCNASIGKTVWDLPGQDAKSQVKTPLLGSGSGGRLQLLVEQSGKFIFDWSLAGQREGGRGHRIFLRISRLPGERIAARSARELDADNGQRRRIGGEAAVDGRRRWRIDLGGNSRFHLRLAAAGAAYVRPPSALLGESRVYDFSSRGVDLSPQWKLRVHDEPLVKIGVLLDPGLQLTTARSGR